MGTHGEGKTAFNPQEECYFSMVWECFLLVNEKYNPITQERQNLALLRRFNLQRVDTRGEQYRKGLNREAPAALRV